jgi:hypothetical protein
MLFGLDFRPTLIVLLLFMLVYFLGAGLAAKVDVEIYKNVEDGEMTYCESGTLVDPPYQYMGSGKIDGDKASAC